MKIQKRSETCGRVGLTSGISDKSKPSENKFGIRLAKEKEDDLAEDLKCNAHIFQPIQIKCSKLFNLTTDVGTKEECFQNHKFQGKS